MTQQIEADSATDAVLFLPGIGEYEGSDEAALVFAARVAASLDHGAQTARAVFRVKSRVEEARKEVGDHRFLVCQVIRVEPDAVERAVLDIYKLDYHSILVSDYEQRSSLARAAITAIEAVKGLFRIAAALGRGKGLGTRRLLQVLIAFFMWVLLSGYFLLLLASIVAVIANWWNLAPLTDTWLARLLSRAIPPLVLFMTVLTAMIPGKWKSELVRTGANYVRMCTYLSVSDQRTAVLGRFHALLEHIAEKEPAYRRTHIMAYSFGSIVALDALFPPAAHRAARFPRLASVEKLISVGCPFDFIRALWPRYFEGRLSAADAPKSWLNVYTPPDALGSNFRDDDFDREATVLLGGRVPDNLVYNRSSYGLLDALTLLALRAHGMYWKRDNDIQDQGCLRETVSVAFDGEPILS
jgi:hypothetical protein